MKIYLLRHTRVDVPAGICYGSTDVPLAKTFEAEAADVIQKLPARLDQIYTSPLRRCQRLAAAVQPSLGGEVIRDGRLREYDFGVWEMSPWAEIQGEAASAWYADFVNCPAPGGESYTQLVERVTPFWEQVVALKASASQPESILIVSHAGVIRALLSLILEIPLRNIFNLSIAYGGLVECTVFERHVQVEQVNR